jgi:hypothetical protein
VTRYRKGFSWHGGIDDFLAEVVTERPLLNVCSGKTPWGDVTLDLYEPADVRGDWISLPFEDDSFGAVFADPPWNSGYKSEAASYVRDALRVAPVAYLMAPWIYSSSAIAPVSVWYREIPGVNNPVLLTRYVRGRDRLAA